ncbi:MAG: FkbM family methyltransferase [Actinobacteria bacterium]|jgi:FkbM family methyltransferase|nr:FkbM family methyltransferase [Actinomycetota bacterium]
MNLNNIKKWIPFTSILPLNTFLIRLKKKNLYTLQLIYSIIGLSGARIIGALPNGCFQVRLNKSSILGEKGTILNVPKDNVIFQNVRTYGHWEKHECEFISRALQTAHLSTQSKVALLDIGANVGLVTLGAMNLSKTATDIHLFEPTPIHIFALKHNLKNLKISGDIFVNEHGLSNKSETIKLYRDLGNSGHSSVFNKAVNVQNREEIEVRLESANQYFESNLLNYDSFIVKSDIQGLDAQVLSNFPIEFWKKVKAAVIEVWAFTEVKNEDVEDLITKLDGFQNLSWDPYFRIKPTLTEIKKYWLSRNNQQRNLYISK